MYAFTNRFTGFGLRDRIRMMNRQRSGPLAFVRYAAWLGAVGLIILACRHKTDQPVTRYAGALPATSPTRALVADLEDTGYWYRHMALFTDKKRTEITYGEPILVSVKQDKLQLSPDHQWDTAIFIDGKKATPDALAQLSPDQVDELFLMHQFENLRGADHTILPYQLMIQTRGKVLPFDINRQAFFTLLQAADLSKHPLGDSYSFTMNQLLEATFFHNKDALVERTKDDHLKVYDEFLPTTEIFINNIRSTAADVATIHIREVARLHTKERPFRNWFRRDNPIPRFALFIQTEPKRANRDSSYYVFSPFYTGDF